MIVGGYQLHLYCKVCNAFAENSENYQNYAESIRAMRGLGWVIYKGDCTCPKCAKLRLKK